MENPVVVVVATVVIIALSAFFVAVEFALIAAKRHRLEDAARTSRSAQAAVRSAGELSVLLAGSQLGITVCTLALGALTKPAVHHWLTPALEGLGAAAWVADAAGFVLALVVVTFLHLVVGEMAPKSWAIAHPERSAIALALPMRGFMAVTRPLLVALDNAANWCLRRVGVDPVDELATGQDPDDLRHLVEHSAHVGALDAAFSANLTQALDLQTATLGDLVRDGAPTAVTATATVGEVREASRLSGHLRILVTTGPEVTGLVHVRDALLLPAGDPIDHLVRPVLALGHDTPAHEALARMREHGGQLVVVRRPDGGGPGVVTVTDLVRQLLPA